MVNGRVLGLITVRNGTTPYCANSTHIMERKIDSSSKMMVASLWTLKVISQVFLLIVIIDFCNYWTQIDIVRVFDGYAAEMNKKSEWQCNTIIGKSLSFVKIFIKLGEWNKGSWGGCFSKNTLVSHLNPQYLLEVPVDTEAIFSLSQYDYR